MKMRFPKHLYFFELVKENHTFQIQNEVEHFVVKFQDRSVNLSKQNCEVLFDALQRLGFALNGG